MSQKPSEYRTGYSAWNRAVLERLPLLACSDDFVFDNQMLAQAAWFGFRIGEISCPTKCFPEASSIGFRRTITYGLDGLRTSTQYRVQRLGLVKSPLFDESAGARLESAPATEPRRRRKKEALK